MEVKIGKLVDEVREWNSPVIGAYLLWRFTDGFTKNHPVGDAPVVILHFIASGILTDHEICDAISGHRPNLASFVRWFNEEKRSDMLACLQHQVIKKRHYAMASIDIAVANGFLVWDNETAKLFPRLLKRQKNGTATMGIAVHKLGEKAEILGKWFSQNDLSIITASLGIVL
jgi:hypothetical protein